MTILTENSVSLTVPENSIATAIAIPAPSDGIYPSAQLTITINALPADGTVLLADGVTPVTVGETLSVTQLVGLRFRPALDSFGQSGTFAFTVSDPGGNTASATASLAIGASNTPVLASGVSLTVPANSPTTPIGIPAPSDATYSASQLTITVTALPSDGTVLLSDGVTAVTVGESLTVAQLATLEFKPAVASSNQVSTFAYRVSDPGSNSTTGSALLEVTTDTPPAVAAAALTVAENSSATPIGIAAPSDPSFPASALNVTVAALPSDGTVVLSDGATPVAVGESLSVAQLTGLQFVPAAGAFARSSVFSYKVTDPSGAAATGSANLSIGPQSALLVTTPAAMTAPENATAAPIGIIAPSDVGYAASQLSVTVTALPTNGTVLLAGGVTAVAAGESLTVAQLTGLEFRPSQDNTGQSSTLGYTVSDPGGHTAAGTATLTTGPNAIVLENEKPGTSQDVWQISPGQDSTTIQGFTTSISTNVGGTVKFKIDNLTGSPNYHIDIYRLGYYGGDGATLVTTLNHQASSAVVQPAPLTDPATGLVDAGNWSVTDSWAIPAGATSGVYVANVIDGSQVFQIPFVVTDDASHSDIVFQTDDETWQAYNGWGGANLYGGNGPAPTGAAYAVSYNRPITTRDNSGAESGPQDSVFGAEYAAIYWLEENGYDISYLSGMDVATNGSLLLDHKVFMDVGHDEYWTDSQAANVQAAVKAGVNAAFLSGNEMFWQTRLEPSIDGSGSADRTLVTYKDTHFNTIVDPTGTATGTFQDPRFGTPPKPANALTGQVFQVDGPNPNSTTITIPYGDTQLRVWRNTSVAKTAPGQTASLTPGLLGYEWDSSPDNGFMPAGLVDLSSTTIQENGYYNIDYGSVDASGTATHNLVEYRDPTSGALVFGAGTVFWSWGLSDQHDESPYAGGPPDPSVQQATVNFLADMGVQPGTLQASLKIASQSTDHTPPKSTISSVSSTNPVEGQTVTVSGTATDAGGGVIGGVQVSTDGGKTWHPASSPEGSATANWTYSFTAPAPGNYIVESRAVDDSLNLETSSDGVVYGVTPSSSLSLFSPSSTPATADVPDIGVEVGVKFTSAEPGEITGIRFYKGPTNTGTHIGDLWSASGALLATVTFTGETASGWQQAIFAAPVKINPGTTYIASYHMTSGGYSDTPYYFANYQGQNNGSLSAAGNSLNGVFGYGSSSTFPTNVSVSADNYWVDVVFADTVDDPQPQNISGLLATENTALVIPVSTLLAGATDPLGFTVSFSGVSTPSGGTVSYDAASGTVTFTPDSGYTGPASFLYTVSDGHGATGSAGVSLTVNYPATAQSLFFTSDTPAVANSGDANPVELGVKFQASTNGTVTGIRFYKGSLNTGTHVGDLWSASGALLATVTFSGETASGWQEADFSTPVAITAGTTYIASYHTSSGNYSYNLNYFANPHTNGQLTAPAEAGSGGDGVYGYGANPVFPGNDGGSANYWVDLVFDANGSAITATPDTGYTTAYNTALAIPAASLLANDTDSGGYALSFTGVSNPKNGTVSYDAASGIVTFTPNSGYVGPAGFTYSIADSNGAAASGAASLNVDYPATAQSLFFAGDTPSVANSGDANPVELGVKFSAATNGTVTGIRFYKGSLNTGTHVGDLWSGSGALLATVTFSGETASGWQEADFSTPVAITAGTTYIASYHTNTGNYAYSTNYFANPHTNGQLTAPAEAASGGDGVYGYGANPVFPGNDGGSANYWVDLVFDANGSAVTANPDTGLATPENTALAIPAATLLANDTDSGGFALSLTSVSNPKNGAVSYDAASQTVTFTPNSAYVGPASFTYTASDTNGGTGSANVSLTIGTPQSLFLPSDTPAIANAGDTNAAELGVKFQASTDGAITGIRFYKGSQNTGAHVGDLWNTSGGLLGTVNFTNETASGWQEADFSTPVAITAGTTYVASYHTNTGNYSVDPNYFATAHSNGPLTAPASSASGGNGVFAYGGSSLFPNQSFNASNYWVDVVFNGQLAA